VAAGFLSPEIKERPMSTISVEAAVEGLWQALEFEIPSASDLTDRCFDEITYHLHRSPRFRGMTLTEIDLILADARREFERELEGLLGGLERRLIRDFKNEIGFGDSVGGAE
jgi:hypothetical protein